MIVKVGGVEHSAHCMFVVHERLWGVPHTCCLKWWQSPTAMALSVEEAEALAESDGILA